MIVQEDLFIRMPAASSQAGQILDHLRRIGPITPLEALELYGCFRLAARIKDLRELGWAIETGTHHIPSGKTVARYWLGAGHSYPGGDAVAGPEESATTPVRGLE